MINNQMKKETFYHYVTFGSNHVHNVNGKRLDATTVARYKTTSYEEGRKKAFELFDSKFSFDYPESNWDESNMRFFPNGYIDLD